MQMTRFVLVFCLLFSAGCPGGGGDPDALDCALGVAWGPRRGESFVQFRDGDAAEITLGFQGFRYIDSTVEIAGPSGPDGDLWFQIAIAGSEPYALRQRIAIPEGASNRYVDDVLVFFNDTPIAELVGREADVTARLSSQGCEAVHRATVTMADDDSCVEQSDGGLVCD